MTKYHNFYNTWSFVGFSKDVKLNRKPISKIIMGQEIKLSRTQSGEILVLGGDTSAYKYPTYETAEMVFAWFHEDRIKPTWEMPNFDYKEGKKQKLFNYYSMAEGIDTHIIDYIENSFDPKHFKTVHKFYEGNLKQVNIDGVHLSNTTELKALRNSEPAILEFHWYGPSIGYLDVTVTFGNYQLKQRNMHIAVIENDVHYLYNVKLINENNLLRYNHFPKDPINYLFTYLFSYATRIADRQDYLIWTHRKYLSNPDLNSPADEGFLGIDKWMPQFYPKNTLE